MNYMCVMPSVDTETNDDYSQWRGNEIISGQSVFKNKR